MHIGQKVTYRMNGRAEYRGTIVSLEGHNMVKIQPEGAQKGQYNYVPIENVLEAADVDESKLAAFAKVAKQLGVRL